MSVYNGEKYLNQAIESILKQSLADFELLVINDGSTDKTFEILDKYQKQDSRVKIIHQEKNFGLTKSLNKAIRLAQGKYLARIDADDLAYSSRFEKQADFLEKHSKIALVGSQADIINEEGKIIGKLRYPTNDQEIRKQLIKHNPFGHSLVMFRREILKKTGDYNEDFICAQDYDLWMKISKHTKLANISETLGAWRLRKEAITSRKNFYQLRANLRIQKKTISDGLYPWYYSIFLLRTCLLFLVPIWLRTFIKKRTVWK